MLTESPTQVNAAFSVFRHRRSTEQIIDNRETITRSEIRWSPRVRSIEPHFLSLFLIARKSAVDRNGLECFHRNYCLVL